jgi:GT2 family glycosyltransferase
LHHLLEAWRTLGRPALLQARSLCHDRPDVIHYDGAALHYIGLLRLRNWFAPLGESPADGVAQVAVAISLCVLVAREPALRLGGFFEPMEILFEDSELSLRLRIAGYDVAVAERARCLHKGGTPGLSVRSSSDAYAARRTFLHSRNRWLLLGSCYSPWARLVATPGLVAYGLVHLLFVLRSGHLGPWLRGKAAAWRLWPAARARRRLLRGEQCRPLRALLDAGPLTYNPWLVNSGVRRWVQRLLDGVLSLWWRAVARWLL